MGSVNKVFLVLIFNLLSLLLSLSPLLPPSFTSRLLIRPGLRFPCHVCDMSLSERPVGLQGSENGADCSPSHKLSHKREANGSEPTESLSTLSKIISEAFCFSGTAKRLSRRQELIMGLLMLLQYVTLSLLPLAQEYTRCTRPIFLDQKLSE